MLFINRKKLARAELLPQKVLNGLMNDENSVLTLYPQRKRGRNVCVINLTPDPKPNYQIGVNQPEITSLSLMVMKPILGK